jgi:DNA-binding LytR/AlgR family response regulator
MLPNIKIMVKLLLVEDEPIIAKDLSYLLEDLGYAITGICRRRQEALLSLQNQQPDLVLCDINLEGDDWDGIRLAEEIRRLYQLPIIFLTAMTDPATIARAASVEPEAYLTKPFEERQLSAAIALALAKFAQKQEADGAPAPEEPAVEMPPFIAGAFFVKDKKRLVKIRAEDILWIKAEGVYSMLATNQRQFLLSVNLGALEEKLKNHPFARIHRSYLVNVLHVEAVEEDILTVGLENIPLGKSYRDEFYRRLQQL